VTDTTDRDAAEPCSGCGEHPGDNECDGCHLDYCGDCLDAYGELGVCVACAIETGLDHA
jgi:hypothetical protein